MFRSIALLATTSASLLLLSCQPAPPINARAAIDALDKITADDRKTRISNLEYDALVDVTDDEALSGDVRILFDLSDASSDLTVDFAGGTVGSIVVNGVASTADYNDYFITLP
ncbi:MAG: hypothetical protein OEY82_11075, partial [Gammaproteobacteria bacterium]|nr:hypothetical protein [Gammaproteobacteria bacterium]MDH5584394.1 hypothetical protein [Gammaproteobacteria bacterium]